MHRQRTLLYEILKNNTETKYQCCILTQQIQSVKYILISEHQLNCDKLAKKIF